MAWTGCQNLGKLNMETDNEASSLSVCAREIFSGEGSAPCGISVSSQELLQQAGRKEADQPTSQSQILPVEQFSYSLRCHLQALKPGSSANLRPLLERQGPASLIMYSSAPTGVAHWMMGLLARAKSKDSPMSVHPSNSLAAPGDGSKTLGCTSALVIHEDTQPHAFHLYVHYPSRHYNATLMMEQALQAASWLYTRKKETSERPA